MGRTVGHIHIAPSDSDRKVARGHLMSRSTIEVVADLWTGGVVLHREDDQQTGFCELKLVNTK
jgi:predicted DNA-binding protein with PD1-like motif